MKKYGMMKEPYTGSFEAAGKPAELPYGVGFWNPRSQKWVVNHWFARREDAKALAKRDAQERRDGALLVNAAGSAVVYRYVPKPLPPRPSDSWEPHTITEHLNAPFIRQQMDVAWERKYGGQNCG